MRLALLMTFTTAAGLAACAPIPGQPYGYAPGPSYGYTPSPYYPEPAYPYAEPGYARPYYGGPGPGVIVGGERYREERGRPEGYYRGNPNPPRDREARPQQGGQNYGGGRPAPAPAAVNRPAPPQPQAQPQRPPQGGHDPSFNPANPSSSGDRG